MGSGASKWTRKRQEYVRYRSGYLDGSVMRNDNVSESEFLKYISDSSKFAKTRFDDAHVCGLHDGYLNDDKFADQFSKK